MGGLLHSAWAVFRGLLVMVLLSMLLGAIALAVITFVPGASGLTATMQHPPAWLMILWFVVSCAFIVLGGWHAGRVAGHAEIAHAAAVGIVLAVLTLAMIGVQASVLAMPPPKWHDWLSAVVQIPVAMIGGLLARPTVPRHDEGGVAGEPR